MKINSLYIENYKRFEGENEIRFSDKNATVIIGINGAGKTSILDAIAIGLRALIQQYAGFRDGSSIGIGTHEISINKSNSQLKINFEKEQDTHQFKGSISVFQNVSNQFRYDFSECKNLIYHLSKNLSEPEKSEIPIFIYYKTNRSFSGSGVQNYTVSSTAKISRIRTYHNAFEPNINYNQILSWYLQQVNIQNNEKVKRKDFSYELPTLAAITDALNQFLNNLEGSYLGNANVDVSPYNNNLVLFVNKKDTQLEFSQLSAGEKMVIGVVLDIAYRMSIANPKKATPLTTHGIVLIDELELHLHPKWQSSVLEALVKTFSNVQFVISTHAPIIVNHLKNKQILLVDQSNIFHGDAIHKTYGRDINSILEDFMGANVRPPEVKNLIALIEELLDEEKPNFKMIKEKLAELKSMIDPNDHEIIKLETLIAFEEDEVDYKKQ